MKTSAKYFGVVVEP